MILYKSITLLLTSVCGLCDISSSCAEAIDANVKNAGAECVPTALGWYPCCVHLGKSLIKILWTSFCISNANLPAWVDIKIQEDTAHYPAHGTLSRMLASSSTRLKSVSANRIWLQQCLPQPTSPNHSPPFPEATLGCSLQKDSHQFNQEWQSDRAAF